MSTTTAPRPYTAPLPPPNDDPRPEPSVGDVLERAADLLEEFGWCQHALGGTGRGAFCALGALHQADADLYGYPLPEVMRDVPPSLRAPSYEALSAEIAGTSLTSWNNAPGRTKSEVVNALRGAAAAARGETA